MTTTTTPGTKAGAADASHYQHDHHHHHHIVLTGASGYLGQHLLLHAFLLSLDETYTIHALYGGKTPGFVEAVQRHHARKVKSRCACHVDALDLTNEEAVRAWFDQKRDDDDNIRFDVCIHTAALSNPRACQQDPVRAQALNVPKAFFDAIKASGCSMMIALSTDQVYDGTNPPYIEEEDASSSDNEVLLPSPVNVYGQTKLAMEQYLLQLYQNRHDHQNNVNVNVVVLLRSSIILGRKAPILPQHAHDTFLHFCASRQGMDTDFYTDERRSVVSVDDVIASIQWFVIMHNNNASTSTSTSTITSTSTTGSGVVVFNMGGPQSVSRLDMARAVFDHLGYDPVHLIAKEKRKVQQQQQQQDGQQQQQQQSVPSSPLDISMDSSRIQSAITGGQ